MRDQLHPHSTLHPTDTPGQIYTSHQLLDTVPPTRAIGST